MGGSWLDKIKDRAHRIADDEAQRKIARVAEAESRIDAGRQTLVALLEGETPKPSVVTPTVGKLTQTLRSYGPELAKHRNELAGVIARIDAAKSELQRGTPINMISAPLERAMTGLLDRAGVSRDAMPRDLLHDLVHDEPRPAVPKKTTGPDSIAPVGARRQQTSIAPTRIDQVRGLVPPLAKAAVPDLGRVSGWLDTFKMASLVEPVTKQQPQPTNLEPQTKQEPETKQATKPESKIDSELPLTLERSPKPRKPEHRVHAAHRPQPRRETPKPQPTAPVVAKTTPTAPTKPSIAETRALGTARPTKTSLDVVDTRALAEVAKQPLDVDVAPVQNAITTLGNVTRRPLGVELPAIAGRVAATPLPKSLQIRGPQPRARGTEITRAATENATLAANATADASMRSAQVRDALDARTAATLTADQQRAHQLTNAANAASRGLLRKPEATPSTSTKPTTPTKPITEPTPTQVQPQTQPAKPTRSTTLPATTPTQSTAPTRSTTPRQSTAPTTESTQSPTPTQSITPTPTQTTPTPTTVKPVKQPIITPTPVLAKPTQQPLAPTQSRPATTATTTNVVPNQSTKPTKPSEPTKRPTDVDAKLPTPRQLATTSSSTRGPDAYRQQLAIEDEKLAELRRDADGNTALTKDEADAKQKQLADAKQRSHQHAKHHADHQQHRDATGKQRANHGKTAITARNAELQRRQQEYGERSRQQLIAELQEHSKLALALLDMTKDQRIAELTRRLEEQKPQIKAAIDKGKTDATKRWTDDKKVLDKANTDAIAKIDSDCNTERTITANNFATMRQQLRTNPEQAALTALALSKRDQERYETTKKANVKQIQTAANTAVARAQGQVAKAMAVANQTTADGKPTPEATTAAAQIASLTTEIGRLIAQCAKDVTAETQKYDTLIDHRKLEGENAAREIRNDAKAYLASLEQKETAALADVERLRGDGKTLAKERYDHDCERIASELTKEFERLEAERVHEEIEAAQARDEAAKNTTELTEADKQKARAEIKTNLDTGVRKLKRASLAQLGELAKMVATSRDAIDKNLAGLGQATVLATRKISALQTDFDGRIDRVEQYLESKTNTAIANQAKVANAVKAGLQGLRTRRYDTGDWKWGDATAALDAERADFDGQKLEENQFDARRQAELDHLKTAEDPTGRRNIKPDQKPWDEKAKAQEIEKALGNGYRFDYNALRLALATMTPEQIQEVLANHPELKAHLEQANPADKACLDQVLGAKTPADMRAALLNWSTNGVLGNDKQAGITAAIISPIGYLASAGGYDKAAMEAMFNSMSDEEKKQLDTVYQDKYHLSVVDEIKDEAYSVANRDSMLAAWSSDPEEKLRLKAQSSELSGTYGNIIGGIKNVGYLFGYEVTNQQAMNVFVAPQDLVAWSLTKVTGDDSWQQQQEALKKNELDIMIDPNALMDAQREYLKSMQPTPWDSPIEQLRKKNQFKATNDNLRVDGRSLTELDNAAANNGYQKLFGGNTDMTNAFQALRDGNETKFLRDRMRAGLHQHMGSETWIKEGIEDAKRNGKMQELKDELVADGTSYDEMVEKRFRPWLDHTDNVDATYFKVLGEDPADPKSQPDAYARQVAAKLAYYQLGGVTGFSNDLDGIAKEVANIPAEPKDLKLKIQEQYKTIVAAQTTMLPTWLAEVTNPLGNWSTGDVWQDIELTYGGQWNRWTGGRIGKGSDYEKVLYDIENGKATTPQDQYKRALARYQIDMSNTTGMSPVAIAEAQREIERLKAAYEQVPEDLRTANVDTLTPDQQRQLGEVTLSIAAANGWQDVGNQTQFSYVETVGWIVGTTVSTVIIIAGSALTGGAFAAIVVPIAAAVIGGLAAVGVKMAMLGNKYSGTAFQQDFANIVIDAVTAGVIGAGQFVGVAEKLVKGLGIEGKIAQTILRELIENAAMIPGGLGHALLNPEIWKGDSAEVMAKLRGLVTTEALKLVATTAIGAGTKIAMKIPVGGELSTLQDTLYNSIKAGTAATCEIDPSKPLGDQLLNVVKAAGMAATQSLATGAGKRIKEAMTPERAELQTTQQPTKSSSSSSVEVAPDGTIVLPKESSAQYLKELARAAREHGETVKWTYEPTVDADGRRIVIAEINGVSTRIAIDDAAVPRTTEPTTKQEPKQLETSPEPKLLNAKPDERFEQLFTREVDRQRDGVSPELKWKAINDRAVALQAENPVLSQLSREQVVALIGITHADSVDVNRGLSGKGGVMLQQEAAVYAKQVDAALEKLPKEPGTYRRMTTYDEATFAKLEVGGQFREPGILETTNGKPNSFRGETEVVIEGNAKRVDFLAPKTNEHPFLFPSNTVFEVVSVSPDRRKVVLREVEGMSWAETRKAMTTTDAAKTPWKADELTRADLDLIKEALGPRVGNVEYQDASLGRLEKILAGELPGTEYDRRFFHHERIEATLRKLGYGQSEAHRRTIRLMDGVGDNPYDLYHPETGVRDPSRKFSMQPYSPDLADTYETNPPGSVDAPRPE